MRTTPILLAVLLTSSFAFADTTKADLGPGEVREHLKGVDADIAQCYLGTIGDRAGAGRLDVVLSIHRKGIVDRVDIKAPGLPAKLVTKIDACVRTALTGLSFPTRRLGTTAVIPYFWQKTAAPDAGPQESCWDAKGCKTTDDATQQAAQPKAKANVTTTGRQARRAPRS
jgi:hypothetical protein